MSNDLGRRLEAILADIRAIDSCEARIHAASDLMGVLQRHIIDVASIRSGALAQLRSDGWTLARIARVFGISRARAAQLTASDGHAGVTPSP